MLDPNNSYLNPGMAMFSQGLPVVDTTVSSSDDDSNGSTWLCGDIEYQQKYFLDYIKYTCKCIVFTGIS
jgi:hypothetical protein